MNKTNKTSNFNFPIKRNYSKNIFKNLEHSIESIQLLSP